MQDFINTPLALTRIFAEITIEGTIEPFIAGIIFIGMIVALMLPILAIPYIFIKMGSMAAKLQSMGGNMAKGLAKDRYKKSAVGRELAARKQAREATSQRRYLEGKGVGGKLARGVRGARSATSLTPTGRETSRMLNEQMNEARDKITEGRIANAQKYMSLGVAQGHAKGETIESMLKQSRAGTAYTSSEDKNALEYLSTSGAGGRVLATASLNTMFSAEDIPLENGTHEASINRLAGMIDPNDSHENAQFSKSVRDGALKAGYKDLAYGDVSGGTYTKVVGKTPEQIVASGLSGINKESLTDVQIQAAIRAKAARGSNERIQLIQQTMHINKDASIDQLAADIGLTPDLMRQARQSIASNGTIPMPPGI